jgi:NitT/TauT family transport system substrate-binding protein
MSTIRTAVCAVLLTAALCLSTTAQADPLQLRVGWTTAPSHVQPLIDELHNRHPELFRHFGKSYVAHGVRFRGSTPQIQALAIGELEIAAFAPSSLALAILNAHLDLRVVADVFQDGAPGYGSVDYVVLHDSSVKKVEDLRGRRVASNAIGSFGDSSMRLMLHKHGLADSDFTTVETHFANMPAMLDEGKVDLITLIPNFLPMVKSGKYRVLFTAGEAQGLAQAESWAMRGDFIKAHRAALVDFFEDHIRALRWLLDPAHHEEALAITEAVTKAKPESIAYVFTRDGEYRSPDARPNIAALQRGIDNDVKLGILKQSISVSPKYVDLSLIEAAKRRIDGK